MPSPSRKITFFGLPPFNAALTACSVLSSLPPLNAPVAAAVPAPTAATINISAIAAGRRLPFIYAPLSGLVTRRLCCDGPNLGAPWRQEVDALLEGCDFPVAER